MILSCAFCLYDPARRDKLPEMATTVIQGNATCDEHLGLATSGGTWIAKVNHLLERGDEASC